MTNQSINRSYPELWKLYPDIWETKGVFFVWLRGSLRRAIWEKFPIKLKFKNTNCQPVPEGIQTRAKSGAYCALSGEWIGKSNLEVDHIIGNASLRDWGDFESYVLHLLATDDNMQLVGKEAHKIKSYAERMNISYDEAANSKYTIKIMKEENVKDILYFLESYGYNDCTSDAKRRKALEAILKEYCL